MLADVNTTDIGDAIRLGCRTMCSVFNADDDDIPFFGSQVWPEARLSFSSTHNESHVPGRHLNALLSAEYAAGVYVDESCIDRHARAAFLSYSGEYPLPLNRDRVGGRLRHFSPHDVREGFHALYALARFRGSEQALTKAEASIEAIQRLWDREKGWDRAALGDGTDFHSTTFVAGLARAIGPLVKLHRYTGCMGALDLALELARKATDDFFLPGGGYDRESFGTHTHSTTCVLSSLAQLAELNRDAPLMERVRAFYENGLKEIRDEIGWVIESSADRVDPDRGEVNNTGDIVETALILGKWGYPEYFGDAERILRCHLLPSQLRDTSFIREPDNPQNEDGKKDVAARHLGAFGFPAPYGHKPLDATRISFNMDIVGGAVASLCEALRQTVVSNDVRALGEYALSTAIPTRSRLNPRIHTDGCACASRRPGPLYRPHSHLGRARVGTRRRGSRTAPQLQQRLSSYFGRPPLNRWITARFDLSESKIVLKHRTREIGVQLRGDSVAAMSNFGADLTFFPPLN